MPFCISRYVLVVVGLWPDSEKMDFFSQTLMSQVLPALQIHSCIAIEILAKMNSKCIDSVGFHVGFLFSDASCF